MSNNPCQQKHTKYQPTDSEFKCQRCGAPAGDFVVDDSPNMECELIHDTDELKCYGTDGMGCPGEYGATGKEFAALISKRNNLVKCEHCKDTGLVKKAK